jgi:hypothetical protein
VVISDHDPDRRALDAAAGRPLRAAHRRTVALGGRVVAVASTRFGQ